MSLNGAGAPTVWRSSLCARARHGLLQDFADLLLRLCCLHATWPISPWTGEKIMGPFLGFQLQQTGYVQQKSGPSNAERLVICCSSLFCSSVKKSPLRCPRARQQGRLSCHLEISFEDIYYNNFFILSFVGYRNTKFLHTKIKETS